MKADAKTVKMLLLNWNCEKKAKEKCWATTKNHLHGGLEIENKHCLQTWMKKKNGHFTSMCSPVKTVMANDGFGFVLLPFGHLAASAPVRLLPGSQYLQPDSSETGDVQFIST